jgi:hypothetical protein
VDINGLWFPQLDLTAKQMQISFYGKVLLRLLNTAGGVTAATSR